MEAMLWRHDFSKWLVRCFHDMNCKTMNAGEEEKIGKKKSPNSFRGSKSLLFWWTFFRESSQSTRNPFLTSVGFRPAFLHPLHLLLEARCHIIVKIMFASFLQILRDFCPTIIPGSPNVESSLLPHRLESCLMHSEPM